MAKTMLILLEFSVKPEGSLVRCGGIIKVKIEECILYFFLHFVFVCYAQQILGIWTKKEINMLLREFLIVEQEWAYFETTYVLQSVYNSVVLNCKWVEDSVGGVNALNFHHLLLFVLVDQCFLHSLRFDSANGELIAHLNVVRVCIFLVNFHLLGNFLFRHAIGSFKSLWGCSHKVRKGEVIVDRDIALIAVGHSDLHDEVSLEVILVERLGFIPDLAANSIKYLLLFLIEEGLCWLPLFRWALLLHQ